MTRTAFIKELRKALSATLNSKDVLEHIDYYEEFFDMEIKKGKEESEIIEQLGNPRLLAKSILEASGGSRSQSSYESCASDEQIYSRKGNRARIGFARWFMLFIMILIIFVVIGILFSAIAILLRFFLPLILLILLVKMIINILNRK